MLEALESEYVLLFLEDFLLTQRVDTKEILSLWEELRDLNGNCLRLRADRPLSECILVPGHPRLRDVLPGEEFRVSLGVAIWRRSVLLSLLRDGESAWDMELIGSHRSDVIPGFYNAVRTAVVRNNGLEGGKWKRYNLPLLKREGIPIPPGHPVMTRRESTKRYAMSKIYALIRSVPWAHRLARELVVLRRNLVGGTGT